MKPSRSGLLSGEMRTGRKFCSKKARASPGLCGLASAAFWHTLNSPRSIGWLDDGSPYRIALQLFMNEPNAAS